MVSWETKSRWRKEAKKQADATRRKRKGLTHQRVRGILKKGGVEVGHFSDNRLGMSFFYGGNVSVKNDFFGDGVKVGFNESQGMGGLMKPKKDALSSKKKILNLLKKEMPMVKVEPDRYDKDFLFLKNKIKDIVK